MGQEPQAEGHAEGLAQLSARFPEEDPRILEGFLYVKNDNVEEAIAHYEEVKKWRQDIGPVGIHDVEKYLRSDAYMVTLEYPGCETRVHPPIIFFNGMVRGSKEEMVKQIIYCVERAWANMPSGEPRVKFVINTRNRSFRIPDSNYRAAIFHTMRYHYPWLINCKVIFIDVPSIIAAGLTAVGKMFDKVMTDRFQLTTSAEWLDADDDVRAYAARAPPDFALTWQADRSVSFDVAKLLALRTAAEEGSKPATWDGSGGLMGSVHMFPPLPDTEPVKDVAALPMAALSITDQPTPVVT